ncbi:ParB family transcriptional regulator, chromosome partitioning protein [Methylomarinovum tepidoasis]|uniref:Probable chromosome-partitioning protein ParB n=1 Tax=Methylomarinovum tepidoasis TaxID=2840183 RepID=A0AAU9C4I5_9GAMM|nr:ParB/RepB/Spo0J family partition protein [Methylomarinovum sp. IN45]BCX88407.1 ParB family transcriptional regulator, chromosome partitioning protein [Methylomarinovum sp. IN45]
MAIKKKRGLGRGLDALLGEAALPRAESPQTLPLDRIEPGRFQPRRDIDPDRLAELADSIRTHGVVQPVVVRPLENDRYELIAGERRWRASRLAGLAEIPVVVRRLDDRTALALALIENVQREDLNPLEQAEALWRLLEEFDMTHQQLAEAVGKSRTTITNLLRLLDLEPEVKRLLAEGRIEMGHARALLGLAGEQQLQIARQVADGKLTVRATEALVRKLQQSREKSRQDRPDPDILRLQEELSSLLGAPVTIRHGRGGKGSLVIRYSDLEQLEGLLTRMR